MPGLFSCKKVSTFVHFGRPKSFKFPDLDKLYMTLSYKKKVPRVVDGQTAGYLKAVKRWQQTLIIFLDSSTNIDKNVTFKTVQNYVRIFTGVQSYQWKINTLNSNAI